MNRQMIFLGMFTFALNSFALVNGQTDILNEFRSTVFIGNGIQCSAVKIGYMCLNPHLEGSKTSYDETLRSPSGREDSEPNLWIRVTVPPLDFDLGSFSFFVSNLKSQSG